MTKNLDNGQLAKTFSYNKVNMTGIIYSGPTFSKTGKTAFFRIFRPDGKDPDGQMKSIWKDVAVIIPEGGGLAQGLAKDARVAVTDASIKVRKSTDEQGNVYYDESLVVKAENFRPIKIKEYIAENGSGETLTVAENLNTVTLSGRVFNGDKGLFRSESGSVAGLRISHYAGKDDNGDFRPSVIKDVKIFTKTTALDGVSLDELGTDGTEVVVTGRLSVGPKTNRGSRFESIIADRISLNKPVIFSLKEDDGDDLPAGDNTQPAAAGSEIF